MQRHQLLMALFLLAFPFIFNNAQSSLGAEIVSHQRFGEGLMVTKAKIVPISGTVSNIFFFNRQDQPWEGNVWYEYDWEIRGKFPTNGWSQIRVREENGGTLRNAPVNISTTENLGENFYHYILIRVDNEYVYDIRENFDVSTYDYNNASAHGGNSVSIIVGGPRVYNTGNSLGHIPEWKTLDFSLGITAFDINWTGDLPSGSYSGDFVIDFTRFHNISGNGFNNSPSWQDEFNNNYLDYGKWYPANWDFYDTQFTANNISFDNGHIILNVDRDESSGGISSNNLALSGQASQSSTAHGGSAFRAIDNNTTGNYGGGSVTHTKSETNAWWELELAKESDLDQIVIYNRTDNCCTERLSNFSVSVLNESDEVVWTKFYSKLSSNTLPINLDAMGKKVRINLNGILSLAEVKVFGTQEGSEPGNTTANLALFGAASQSTTAYNGQAARAIDDNTSGVWSQGSVTHTSNQNNSWWEVQLAQVSDIEEIVLYNRTNNCCVNRLSDFTVSVLNEGGSVVWSRFFSDAPTPSLAIDANVTGKAVRVSLNGTLSLAEVQVFGVPSNTGKNYSNPFASLEAEDGLVKVFPNPTNGDLFLDLSNFMEKPVELMVVDQVGKVFNTELVTKDHNKIVVVDMSSLQSGLYMLRIKAENGHVETKKVSLFRL